MKPARVTESSISNSPINDSKECLSFPSPKNLPPLCSLLVGYFSYDIIRYIEKIPNSTKNDLNIPDSRILRPRNIIVHDNIDKKLYFVVNIFNDEKINDFNKKFSQINKQIEEMVFLANYSSSNTNQNINKLSKIKSNISKKKFINNVKKAKKYIKIGDIFQVVLSQRFECKLTKKPIEIYKKLRKTNPSPFMYFFNFNDFQIIGASPEILVRLRDNKITIRPIAGTRPRGKNKKQDKFFEKDLLKDKKELSEHLMLLDLGRNDTGKVSKINSVKVTESFKIERYSHVMHIVSHVKGKLRKGMDCFDALRSCFPAGTVSGAPKIRAMEIIAELEPENRGAYAGAVGYFSYSGDMDTAILLRTIVLKDGVGYVQAGGGIVADSKIEEEYQETIGKSKAMIEAIEAANCG